MLLSSRFVTNSAIANVMIGAVTKAAQRLIRDFGELENLQVSKKGLGDFVSIADRKSEEILIRELSKARPDYNFITEESGVIERSGSPISWVIDPLDGTTNFLHGLPHFAICVALKEYDEVMAGVVYDPIKDELFWSERGKGVFVNQRRLRVSARKVLEEGIVGVVEGSRERGQDFTPERLGRLNHLSVALRVSGSAALDLAYVAAGRYDAFWGEGLSSWDVAAGILFVKEAGGHVQERSGGTDSLNSGSIIASNPHFLEAMQKALQ